MSLPKNYQFKMNIYNYTKTKALQSPYKRFFCANPSQEFQKSVQVTILGAHTTLGKFTSFLLKQNPLVSFLRLQGDKSVRNIAVDLSAIDTRCKVQSFEGSLSVSQSIRNADIILLLGGDYVKEDTGVADRIMKEGKRICDLAKECTNHSPRSIIVVAVPPVSVTTLLVELVFKKTHWYHPGRIIGSAAIAQIKANTLIGRHQGLDPRMCKVPLIGGPDINLAVPLFSQASPVEMPDRPAKQLALKYRGIKDHEFPKVMGKPDCFDNCNSSEAYALWNLISTISLGICGDENAYCNAYVRTNLVNTCKHLVTTIQLSRGGFVHNCGLPFLTKLELQMLERATLQIKECEQMAKEFMEFLDSGKSEVPPFKQKEMEQKKLLNQTVVRG